MAPITTSSDETNHQALLDKLDIYMLPKPFRNPSWKPPQRRNKNLRQIISEASRKEASMMPSLAVSGASTPLTGATTPASTSIPQVSQRLDRLALERSHQSSTLPAPGSSFGGPMAVTYTNIESAPSLHMNSQKKYCDITGLPTSYTDPKSRMRFYNAEVYNYVRTMPASQTEGYLAARGAHTILK